MTDKLFQDFLLSPRKIDTSYNLKALKLLQEALIKDEIQDIRFEGEVGVSQKEVILNKLNKRIHTLTLYYAKATEKQPYKRFIISYNKSELHTLQTDLTLLQEYKQDETLKMKDLIKIKSLAKETLNQDEIQQNQIKKEQEQENLQFIKQTLKNLGGFATNFNQITHNYNQRGLFQKTYSLTKEEREQAIDTIHRLEEMLINLTNYHK